MDIHRCRFVPYPPSTINALAFSHSFVPANQKTASPRLAVGRANGDIEIWNPLEGSWLQETIIKGGKDRSIDGLVWTQDQNEKDSNGRLIIGKSRLFSVGYTTTVTEWDLEKGRPLRQASGNHGEIWCLAAQPAFQPTKAEANGISNGQWQGQNLITGCTDGALVLYSTKDDDLQLHKVLVRPSAKRAKIISVAFQNRNIAIAGCTDSTIRVYDIRNGQNLRNMSLGAGPAGGPREIIVWSIKVLPDGNIVSGDSAGELRVWNGKTYTLMQRIHGHRQDILSLAASFDGSIIFSGGMDRRTVAYKQVGNKGRWAEIGHRRYHRHDVKAMASLECKGVSVIVSGGPDASLTALPLKQFGMENPRTLPFLPQEPALRSSPQKRLLMSFWDREVHIWRLLKPSKPESESEALDSEPTVQNRKLVAKILIKGEANITSATLSASGDLLAISTITDIKIFELRAKAEGSDGLRVMKVDVPSNFSSGAKLVRYSPDSKWLCIIRPDNKIFLSRTQSSASSYRPPLTKLERIKRKIENHITLGGLGTYDRNITQVEFSSDSRILAVSDLAGYIDTFVLSGAEDSSLPAPSNDASSISSSSSSESDQDTPSEEEPTLIYGQHWTRNPSAASFPKLPSAPVVLSFRPATAPSSNGATHAIPTRHNPNPVSHDLPASEDRLLIVTSTSDVFEFSALSGSLTPWSRRNPTSCFPEEFRKVRDLARGCVWDVSFGRERAWLYGVGWLWMFDLARDFPAPMVNGDGIGNRFKSGGRKRKRHGKEEASGAGSVIPDRELATGISRTMRRIVHEEVDEVESIPFQNDDDEMDLDGDEEDFALMRGDEVQRKEGEGEGHWRTFKYRPILGICVIGEGDEGSVGPEVTLVERPIWEADLGPRYFGEQEWEKGGLDL